MSMCLLSIFTIYYYIGLKLNYRYFHNKVLKIQIPFLFVICLIMLTLIIFMFKHKPIAIYLTFGVILVTQLLQFLGYLAICYKFDLKERRMRIIEDDGKEISIDDSIVFNMGIIFVVFGVFIGFAAFGICSLVLSLHQSPDIADIFKGIAQMIVAMYYAYYSIAIRYLGQLKYFQGDKINKEQESLSEEKQVEDEQSLGESMTAKCHDGHHYDAI